MARLEFDDDAEKIIKEGLEESKDVTGKYVAERMKDNTEFFIRGYGGEHIQPLADNITEVTKVGDSYIFSIDHPAAYIHEYGASVDTIRGIQAGNYAFGWNDQDAEKIKRTIPEEYFKQDSPFMLASKGFFRRAEILTKKQMEDEFDGS